METFYTSLATVLNTNKKRAKELVANYSTGDVGFFQTYFDGLKSAKLEESEGGGVNGSVNISLFVEEDGLGSGATGVIRKNRVKPYVYKSMADMYGPEMRLNYLKSIFKEAIIQTLLQSDTKFGRYICTLSAVYRVGKDCVFQLEPLANTLGQHLRGLVDPKAIGPVCAQLFKVIKYFKGKYNFSHNDLKVENVMMVKASGDIKLIDFGLSSVKIGAIELGKPSLKRADIQYFLYSLKMALEAKAYEGDEPDMSFSDFSDFVEELLVLDISTPIDTYIARLEAGKGGSRKTRRSNRFRSGRVRSLKRLN